MRLFVAINFGLATRARLLVLRDELRKSAVSGSFSVPENLHLTLAFLGECDAGQSAAAKAALDVLGFAPFPIVIDRVGRFRRDGGEVWWAGVREDEQLGNLHSELTDKLIAVGFELEKRKYSPHITLGRKIVTRESPKEIEPFTEMVASIELMKSKRVNGKLTYTAIHERTVRK
jgi:2'-5' RNA ligase